MMRLQSGETLIPVRFSSHECVLELHLYIADNYTKLCTIEADLSRVPLLPLTKAKGRGVFYRLDYDIVLLFGMTELKAQVAWKEKVSVVLPSSFFCPNLGY